MIHPLSMYTTSDLAYHKYSLKSNQINMKPILSFLLLFFATFYVSAQDTTPSVLTNITFSPTLAKTGETISVIVEVHDEMSELSSIQVNLSNP